MSATPVTAHLAGGINDDGSVDDKDLNRLLQSLVDWDVRVAELDLETSGDRSVNNKDLTRSFQCLSD